MHLVMIFGPQAVGKMAVGREVARLTPYRLFHNHATIDPLLDVFDHGTPAFRTLNREFRIRVVQEAVASGMPGLVFTFVWALEDPADRVAVEELVAPVLGAAGRVDFVELYADEATRLGREGTELRLAAKPSKRDREWARRDLVESGRRHQLSTGPDQPFPIDAPLLRIDNTELSATAAAERVVTALGLPTRTQDGPTVAS